MNTNELNKLNRSIKHAQTFKKLKIQPYILVLTVLFASCKSDFENVQNDSSQVGSENINTLEHHKDTIAVKVKSLIGFAAYEFNKYQKPLPTAFRNLQIKYALKTNKEMVYLLCGQFKTEDKQNSSDWIDFTTIITDPYEQWIGSNGVAFCENSIEIQITAANLSAELMKKISTLQKTESN